MQINTKRSNDITTEKISLALLARAAFGHDAGIRTALLSGIDAAHIEAVFRRVKADTRVEVPSIGQLSDRRKEAR